MSADPVADFRLSPLELAQTALDPQWMEVSTLASVTEGHGWTDIATARNQYGLSGSKQTVAVIDSGIAWDHVALGGGLGRAYRVVGGWDFAENDANPYDDGPAGFHGTHVAGIIGSSDGRYPGVAPDVDLVGLRVFDDQGNGYFHWVEQALRWVHDHRFDFENPITTVNLSLGSEWNAATLPNWAALEDEFQLLENDGIFISVAAGNSFKQYNAPGLSYPAASQYVVPVASLGANNLLSSFSQRSDRVLVAPGEKIMSTLPDHFYGGDGVKNDMGKTSGTSMAAPYVAGASVLLREAMLAMGVTGVTQDMLYDRFYASADIIYDSITSANYRKVNLSRALESVIGTDEYGSTVASAHGLGALGSPLTVSGTIGRVDDLDFFRFTAQQTGTVSFVMQTGGNLAGKWIADAGGQVSGNKLTFQVVAGQSYAFGIGTQTGIGKYQLQSEFVATPPVTPPPVTPPPETPPPGNSDPPPTNPPPTNPPPSNPPPTNPPTNPPAATPGNLGVVHFAQQNDLNVAGETWIKVTAGRSGVFTTEAFYSQAGGNVGLEIYNAQKLLLRSIDGQTGSERIDFNAGKGSVYYVRLVGSNSDVDLRLTNLVVLSGSTATVHGTGSNDTFAWNAAAGQQNFAVNGTTYVLNSQSRVNFHGNGGSDTVILNGSSAAETVTLRPGHVQLRSANLMVSAYNVETVNAVGGQNDTVFLHDNLGDRWNVQTGWITISSSNYSNTATGFGRFNHVPLWGPYTATASSTSQSPLSAELHSIVEEDAAGTPLIAAQSSWLASGTESATVFQYSLNDNGGSGGFETESNQTEQLSQSPLRTMNALSINTRFLLTSTQSDANDLTTSHAEETEDSPEIGLLLAHSRSDCNQASELLAVEGVFASIGRD